MMSFSLFPTQFWAKHSPQQFALVWKKGKTPLLADLPERFSWQEWHHLVAQSASFLDSLGVSGGQTVAYLGDHRLIGLLCYCSVIALGGRILMLNPATPDSQYQTRLAENDVSLLITDQDFAKFSPNLIACNPFFYQPHQPATFTLTSGSSGSPKAVVHTVQQHLANAEGVCELMKFKAGNAWLLSLPLFHVSGQGIVWRWLAVGATLIVVEEKQDFLDNLAQVSHASLVPTQLQRYLANLTSPVMKSQHFLLGGATIPSELIAQAQQFNIITYAGYGMTEMASTICAVKYDHDNVGKPLSSRAVKIVENEIWVKGACLALGYYQDHQIQPLTNAEGWFATKDRGEWNEQGKLVVQGRLDNMFISGGENIQPEAVEAVLFSSGIIETVFVIPVVDQEFGERPVALVTFKAPFEQQAVDSLKIFAKQHLEPFKQPIDYLPLDLEQWQKSGIKISRLQLKQYVARILKKDDV